MELVLVAGISAFYNGLMGQQTVYGARESLSVLKYKLSVEFESVAAAIKTSTDVSIFTLRYEEYKNFLSENSDVLSNSNENIRPDDLLRLAIQRFNSRTFNNIEIIKRLTADTIGDTAEIKVNISKGKELNFHWEQRDPRIQVISYRFVRRGKRQKIDLANVIPFGGVNEGVVNVKLNDVRGRFESQFSDDDEQESKITFLDPASKNFFNDFSANVQRVEYQSAFVEAIQQGKVPVVELFLQQTNPDQWPIIYPAVLPRIDFDKIMKRYYPEYKDGLFEAFIRAFDYAPTFDFYPYSELFTSQPVNPDGTMNGTPAHMTEESANAPWSCKALSASCLKSCIIQAKGSTNDKTSIFWKGQPCYALHVKPGTRALALSLPDYIKSNQAEYAEVVFPPDTIYKLTDKTQKITVDKHVVEFEGGDQTLELQIVEVSSPPELPSKTMNLQEPAKFYVGTLGFDSHLLAYHHIKIKKQHKIGLLYENHLHRQGIEFVTKKIADGSSYDQALKEWDEKVSALLKDPHNHLNMHNDFTNYWVDVINEPSGFKSNVPRHHDLPGPCDQIVAKSRDALSTMLRGDNKKFFSAIAFLTYPLLNSRLFKLSFNEMCTTFDGAIAAGSNKITDVKKSKYLAPGVSIKLEAGGLGVKMPDSCVIESVDGSTVTVNATFKGSGSAPNAFFHIVGRPRS